jgi:hypothetical protein
MKTIHKYPVHPTEALVISMPIGAEILCFQMQNGWPFIWAIVNTKNQTEDRKFSFVVTGENISDLNIKSYIGTVQKDLFVFHLFEINPNNL